MLKQNENAYVIYVFNIKWAFVLNVADLYKYLVFDKLRTWRRSTNVLEKQST